MKIIHFQKLAINLGNVLILFCLLFTSAGSVQVAQAAVGDTTLISFGSFPSPLGANSGSYNSSISADGRYVTFYSGATDLVSDDTNGKTDIFVFDRQTGLAERVSVDSSGSQANGNSSAPSISANGQYVAFVSDAGNLVSNDTNSSRNVFLHDRQTGVTERISATPYTSNEDSAYIPPAISADGRYVAYGSVAGNIVPGDTNGREDIFVLDRQTGITERVSIDSSGLQANDDSYSPAISSDGRYVAFASGASNLVNSDTNGTWDIFMHDRQTGITERVSVNSNGSEGNNYCGRPSISTDGRYVVFESTATNLVNDDANGQQDVFIHDRQTGATERVSVASNGTEGNYNSYAASISSDGRYVAFASYARNLVGNDTNNAWDVFVQDHVTGVTERVSIDANGMEGGSHSERPSISADGRYVAFESDAKNLVKGDLNQARDIFVHDRQMDETEPVSVGPVGMGANQSSYAPFVSGDGRYVSFLSAASNLVSDDTNGITDVFVYDRQTSITERVSVDSDGVQANDFSYYPAISADGRYVAFVSLASDLMEGDTNNTYDIFVHDRQTGITERVSVDSNGLQANGGSDFAAISGDGRYIVFESYSSNLVSGDTGVQDIFIHDLQTGATERISVAPGGVLANNASYSPAISVDGRYVAFSSRASNLVSGDTNNTYDIFVFDRQTGVTERASVDSSGMQANNSSGVPSISADGRYVSFVSTATNLVNNDTNGQYDVFVHDRQTGVTERVSVDSSGMQANISSSSPSISANGQFVTFISDASNLVNGDTNNVPDIFIRDLQTDITERVSVDSSGAQANGSSGSASISANGQFVTFTSSANNLVNGDTNYANDIFMHENDIWSRVVSIVRVDSDPTSAASVNFTVTFLKAVTGVDASDFALTITGAAGAFIVGVSGSGTAYTVTVNTGSGNGTIRLDVVDNNSIVDAASNPLGGASVGDGDFATGEVYTVNKSAGRDTTGVFRPSNGLLYLKNQNTTGFADIAINYGMGGDYPVVGDWDGNGTATIGIYRNGSFYLRNANTLGFADWVFPFGQVGDQPIAGDWNGDGIDTIGVYRPSNGQFLLRNSNDAGPADAGNFFLGNPGDVGIAGDWTGKGYDTVGVFRPSNGIIFLKNTNQTGFADIALNYGIPGDGPVTGDWNDDGKDTIGVYRNGQFLLRNSNEVGFAEIVFGLGNPGDMPIAGNWDGLP